MMSHEELGISFAEFGALLGTREMLKANVLIHSPDTHLSYTSNQHLFNMDVTCRKRDCGTVGCIGGTVAFIMGMHANHGDDYVHGIKGPLRELYYPSGVSDYNRITSEQAVKAIDNFLNTGLPMWVDVMSKK